MSEKIEIGYRNIGNKFGVDYHHKFILYTNKDGQQFTISGWTDDENQNPNLPFGNIRILANSPYDENNPDSPARHPEQKQYRELIAEAPDLSAKWQEMVRNAQSKDNIYPYDYLRQNSNTLADTLLREAGFPEPEKDGIFRHLAPGSGNKLDRNLVPQHPDDAGISDLKDLSYLEEEKFKENPQYAMQTQSEPVENPKPQSKYEETMAMLQGLLNDTDGSYAKKLLADNPDKVASFNERVQQALEEERQQQLVTQENQNIQQEQQRGFSRSV